MSSVWTSGGKRLAGLPAVRPLAALPAVRSRPLQPATGPAHLAIGRARDAAILFGRIREVAGLDLIETAQRLHTFPSVIDALEQGDFEHLPPWPETVVVVSGFTALAGIDPRPVLTAIRECMNSKIIEVQAAEVVPSTRLRMAQKGKPIEARIARSDPHTQGRNGTNHQTASVTPPAAAWSGVLAKTGNAFADGHCRTQKLAVASSAAAGRSLRPLLEWADALKGLTWLSPSWRKPVALSLAASLPLAALVSFGSSSPLQAAVASLPQPVAGAFRSLEDYVQKTLATERNGLLWIEVSDPRSRKTDKLPSPRR